MHTVYTYTHYTHLHTLCCNGMQLCVYVGLFDLLHNVNQRLLGGCVTDQPLMEHGCCTILYVSFGTFYGIQIFVGYFQLETDPSPTGNIASVLQVLQDVI